MLVEIRTEFSVSTGTRLPDEGNANIRQRDSGHLVVSYDRRGFGLIKTSISTAARARSEFMSKLFADGAYAHQLEPRDEGKDSWTKCQGFKPDLRNSDVRHYRGASGDATLV